MIFALLDYQGGIEGMVGMVIFQPILAVILSVCTIVICLIVGLPIRLNKNLFNWWTNKFYIPIIGIICGISLLILSFFPYFLQTITMEIEGQETIKKIPNLSLVLSGWFLTAFSTLHLFPPLILRKKLENILAALRSKNKNGL